MVKRCNTAVHIMYRLTVYNRSQRVYTLHFSVAHDSVYVFDDQGRSGWTVNHQIDRPPNVIAVRVLT